MISRLLRVVALVLMFLLAPIGGGLASAHTDFESSSPANGDSVRGPVQTVTVAFTAPATPVGQEFVALNSAGELQTPDSVSTTDDQTFVLTFDPPLRRGDVGIRWEVQAGDAHPIAGAFTFTVRGSPRSAAQTPDATSTTSTAPAAETSNLSAPPSSESTRAEDEETITAIAPSDEPPSAQSSTAPTLDEFLAEESERTGEGRSRWGRIVGYTAIMLALGGLVFLARVMRGSRREIAMGVNALRALGAVIVIAAAVEYIGTISAIDGSYATSWTSSPGLAMALRAAGGLLLLAGLTNRAVTPAHVSHALSAAVLEAIEPRTSHDEPQAAATEVRWQWRSAKVAWAGAVLMVISFWFTGHTVSKGFRPLHALVNSVHVIAGGLWVGGVVALALVVSTRWRRSRSTHGTEMVLRFSSIAAIALVAVAGAGALMAMFILDSPGELTGTEWGRLLLLKTGAVGVAAGYGAHNHFHLLPRLEASPADAKAAAELRSSLIAEAIVFAFVIVVTGWLVAAAS